MKYIKLSIYVTCLIMAIVCALSYFNDAIVPLKIISTVASASEVVVIAYFKWLWRIKWLNFFKIPDLNGKWICQIDYEKGINYPAGTKVSEWRITQDLFNIQINFDTNEIRSHSVSASIVKEHNEKILFYIYRTDPSKQFKEKNPAKWGAAKIYINKDFLTGDYWTSDGTSGTMTIKKR